MVLPALALSVMVSSLAISGGNFTRYRLTYTVWLQAAVSGVLAALILASTLPSPLPQYLGLAVVLLISCVISIWLGAAAPIRPGRVTGSEPTLVSSPMFDPRVIVAALEGRYTDITLIAAGGLARVYRATRRRDRKIVAIKIPLHLNEVTGASFLREMLAWQNLSHPRIVTIYEIAVLPVPLIEMEYLERSLAELPKPVSVPVAVPIIRGVAEGLAYAHHRGVVHRDIKPENILLTKEGAPKISDWGLSRIQSMARMPTVVGFSLSYAAPEQVDPSRYGETDERTDIFQLGVVFYELVTGRLPFTGEGIHETTRAILDTTPVSPSEIVPATKPVEPVILRCLEKEPRNRYPSAEGILEALKQVEI